MAYIDQKKKAVISANLAPVLARYGLKGTLSVRNHLAIVLTLKSGRIDFIKNFNTRGVKTGREERPAGTCLDVNPYWYHEHFDGDAKAFLSEALRALKSADWYDRSDAMTDYFDTAYYVDIKIGRSDRPYQVTR